MVLTKISPPPSVLDEANNLKLVLLQWMLSEKEPVGLFNSYETSG